jgi:hypothetical protein
MLTRNNYSQRLAQVELLSALDINGARNLKASCPADVMCIHKQKWRGDVAVQPANLSPNVGVVFETDTFFGCSFRV